MPRKIKSFRHILLVEPIIRTHLVILVFSFKIDLVRRLLRSIPMLALLNVFAKGTLCIEKQYDVQFLHEHILSLHNHYAKIQNT